MADGSCPECFPPQQAVDEIDTFGATITREITPFPITIEQQLDETVFPAQIIGEISLFFTPREDDLTISLVGILNEQLESMPYSFTFSTLVGNEFIEIPPGNIINQTFESLGSYGGHLRRYANAVPLHGEGNYVLFSDRQLRIPVNATHVELWFQEDSTAERELLRRVALAELTGWQRYFNPN